VRHCVFQLERVYMLTLSGRRLKILGEMAQDCARELWSNEALLLIILAEKQGCGSDTGLYGHTRSNLDYTLQYCTAECTVSDNPDRRWWWIGSIGRIAILSGCELYGAQAQASEHLTRALSRLSLTHRSANSEHGRAACEAPRDAAGPLLHL
jgi:hypothetical protein